MDLENHLNMEWRCLKSFIFAKNMFCNLLCIYRKLSKILSHEAYIEYRLNMKAENFFD